MTKDTFNPIKNTTEGWFDGKKIIPFNEMTDEHIQRAHGRCQNKEREYTAKAAIYGTLQDKLEEEALRRGITIKPTSAFGRNNMAYRSRNRVEVKVE